MNSIRQVDELVKEYLLFRGFNATFRAFEADCKGDKDKGFQVDKVVEELFRSIHASDISGLMDYWRYLDIRYFSRIDGLHQQTIRKFELCLYRYYLVYASQNKRKDKITEFFELYGHELENNPEWTKWFAFAYSKNPAADSTFETYFTKTWLDNFQISLYNFLSAIFSHMPLPSLLAFNLDRMRRRSLQAEVESLKSALESSKAQMEESRRDYAKLESQLAALNYRKRASSVNEANIARRSSPSANSDSSRNRGLSARPLSSPRRNTSTGATVREEITTSIGRLNDISGKQQQDAKMEELDTAVDEVRIKYEENDDGPVYLDDETDPYVITKQEEFLEHSAGIVHAKFSNEGKYISSCDTDNVIKIWSYDGNSSHPSIKIPSTDNASTTCLEWDARSDRTLLFSNNRGVIRTYNTESKTLVQDFKLDIFPSVTALAYSPVEPRFVSTSGVNPSAAEESYSGALVSWNLKSAAMEKLYTFESTDLPNMVNTVKFNHNGQLVVVGDQIGFIRIFDLRTVSPIIEWGHDRPHTGIYSAQFTFDETSIMTVDDEGYLIQWSIHKPGVLLSKSLIEGFPTKADFAHPSNNPVHLRSTSPLYRTSDTAADSIPSDYAAALPPLAHGASPTPSIKTIDSLRSKQSTFHRSQLVSFSIDTEHVLAASMGLGPASDEQINSRMTSHSRRLSAVRSRQNSNQSRKENEHQAVQGVIFSVINAEPIIPLASHQARVSAVDWNKAGTAVLSAAVDGTIKVAKLLRT